MKKSDDQITKDKDKSEKLAKLSQEVGNFKSQDGSPELHNFGIEINIQQS